jgi:hypothetical protein
MLARNRHVIHVLDLFFLRVFKDQLAACMCEFM